MENLDAIATMRLTWMAGLSAEDKAKLEAERASWADEAVKAEKMAELTATFGAADVNADGVLDMAEFTDFMGKIASNATARGVPTQGPDAVDDDMKAKVFAFYDAQDAGTPGVTVAEFLKGTAAVTAAIKAKMAGQ